MNTKYNLKWLFENIKTELDAAKFLQEKNIIPQSKKCQRKHEMELKEMNGCAKWRCNKSSCGQENVTVRKNTWLEGSKLPLTKIIIFIYSWAKDYTSSNYCNDEIEINKDTAVDFNNYLREVCAETLLKTPMVIGGPDTTVEIDETHFSKRKYNRGRELPEQWVFGGVCRETKECFLYAVPRRNAETLTQCIKRSIRPGTTIISDLWKAYDGISLLDGYNYKHCTVNHSKNFVDPKTGANTQAVESMWHSLKMKKKRQGGIHRQMIDSYLCEFVWRKRIEKDQYFEQILLDISNFDVK
ncbi:male abnormal protein mab-31-like [Oratosquilla oratoria]|uniref:male abnormal protein mab-31-like n=1 Tax=Oratosquilla oratoria TaxID=337810 RepID=UPI003F76EE8E